MLEEVFLIGTVHVDPRGPERLAHALEFYKPDVIAIEAEASSAKKAIRRNKIVRDATPERFNRFLRHAKVDPSLVNLETTRRFAEAFGYEAYVSQQYADFHGIPLVHLDEGELYQEALEESRVHIEKYRAQFKTVTMQLLGSSLLQARSFVDMKYLLLNGKDNLAKTLERNAAWAQKIRALDGRVAVVAGAAHVFGIEPNLQTIFRDVPQGYVYLNEAMHL